MSREKKSHVLGICEHKSLTERTFFLKSILGVTLSPTVIRLEEPMVRIYLPV